MQAFGPAEGASRNQAHILLMFLTLRFFVLPACTLKAHTLFEQNSPDQWYVGLQVPLNRTEKLRENHSLMRPGCGVPENKLVLWTRALAY